MPRPDEEVVHRKPTSAQRIYVYGIIRTESGGEQPNLPPLNGLASDPVHTICVDGVAALVSTLALRADGASFDEELKDPEQAKSLILDHHRVLQHILGKRTVLPVRFGALFANVEKVRGVLREHREGLLEALERVEDAREWGVKIFCDRTVLRGHLGTKSLAMLAAQDELAASTQGRAFFLQRRIARLGEEEVERAIAQDVEESHRRLCGVARAGAAMKFQPAAVHMHVDDMVANDAYLVAKADEECFFALIDELRQAHEPRGCRTETNGPWPPFSFADCRLGE